MKKIIRNMTIGIAAIFGLLIVMVVIFTLVFDANEYKQDLSDLVLEQTGRELRFHGDVSLTLFPALGMKLGAMSFSNAAGFGAQAMIKVSEVSISVDLASLISFSPEVEKLVLRDLEVNLIRNKAGVSNWDDLVAKPAAASTGESASASPPASVEITGAFGGLDLQNIKLLWLDEQAGSQYRINDLDITTGRIVPNQPFPLSLHVDADSAGEFNLTMDFKADLLYLIEQEKLSLENILLALNEFEITGQAGVSNFAQPAIEFNLASQNLDLDALMARTLTQAAAATSNTAGSSGAASPVAETEDVQIVLPLETLRGLDIDGRFAIANLRVQNLQMSNVELELKASKGIVALDPLTMKLYDGSARVSVELDARSAVPKYKISKTLEQVQVGDLRRDYAQLDTISGGMSANIELTSRGEWVSELKKNSNGLMKLAFFDGALKGFNIRHSIDLARARIRGKKPPVDAPLQTDFSSLSISGVIRNGIFSSDDLDLQAPLLRVGGKGTANLNTSILDYLVNAKLVGTIEGQQGEKADQLSGLSIPVKVEGPFANPKIDVQLDEMLKAKADAAKARLKADIARKKAELKKQIEEAKKKLAESKKREFEKKLEIEKAKKDAEYQKKIDDAANDLLKKLFN